MLDVKIRSTNLLVKRYKNVHLLVDKQQDYPCLKLINRNSNKLINISKACKVFNVHSKNKTACKLFLVKKEIRISCLNGEEIKKLQSEINDVLLNYHKEITEDYLVSSISELDVNMSENKNMAYYESIFEMDYTIPDYDGNAQTFDIHNKIGFDLPGNVDSNQLHDAIEILELRQQILHPGGVIVKIDKTTLTGFSVKDCDEHLWISKVKNCNEKLYFGDRIVKLFDKEINSELEFHENIREGYCYLTVQRLPNSKVFIFDKSKFKNATFQLKKKKYILFKLENQSTRNWVITELNGFDALDLSRNYTKLKLLLDSKPTFLSLIIHPEEFVNNLID